MDVQLTDVRARLEAFVFDETYAAFTFTQRLGRENGWEREYAERVVTEYRRFAFLAVAAGHPVTPSDAVDQAWHLHLTYTESYWERFCKETLGQPLHHGPTRGGPAEHAKYHDWYTRTLESYERLFGQGPPSDIWPDAETRFTNGKHFVRVNRQHFWMIPKPLWWPAVSRRVHIAAFATGEIYRHAGRFLKAWAISRTGRFAGIILALAAATVACQAVTLGSRSVLDYTGPEFLGFFVIFAFAVFLVAAWWRSRERLPAEPAEECDLPSDPYEVAYLAGGPTRVIEAGIAALLRRGALETMANSRLHPVDHGDLAYVHPVEQALFRALKRTPQWRFENACKQLHYCTIPMLTSLRAKSFLLGESAARHIRRRSLLLALIVPLLGMLKIAIGISRERPVGFLCVLTVLSTIVAIAYFGRRPVRTRRGDDALQRLEQRHANMQRGEFFNPSNEATHGTIPLAVGLYGITMLANTSLAESYYRIQPRRDDMHGAGYSGGGESGDGGGGDSSGCGGCGGGGGD